MIKVEYTQSSSQNSETIVRKANIKTKTIDQIIFDFLNEPRVRTEVVVDIKNEIVQVKKTGLLNYEITHAKQQMTYNKFYYNEREYLEKLIVTDKVDIKITDNEATITVKYTIDNETHISKYILKG